MSRKLLLLLLNVTLATRMYGQCSIEQDSAGQVVTTCQFGTKSSFVVHRYLGSEFLTFPIWQPGALTLGNTNRQSNGMICYNVYTKQVFYRPDDSTTLEVLPDAFTLNGASFVRHTIDGAARPNYAYFLVRYPGRATLLEGLRCTFEPIPMPLKQLGDVSPYVGQYKKQNGYYLRKEDGRIRPIELTRKAFLAALYEQAEPLQRYVTHDKLTLHEAIGTMAYYDSLMAVKPVSDIPLNDDPVFRETLHQRLRYPNQAWNQGIYSRVYVGFRIDQLGHIGQITPLSPDNVGFGFIDAVTKVLKQLPALAPTYAGQYVLPVAFSFTNASDTTHTAYTPLNRLLPDKAATYQMLNELQVPVTINKPARPGQPMHEVWGYYR